MINVKIIPAFGMSEFWYFYHWKNDSSIMIESAELPNHISFMQKEYLGVNY